MSSVRFVAVIDIGKTNAKLAVFDLESHREVTVRTFANVPVPQGPYPHTDIEAIWEFICSALAKLNAKTPIQAICTTTHGACAALVAEDGDLVLPVLDYEYPGPDECRRDYDRVRPDFCQSSTPPLPGGLNLARQLFWQARRFPAEFAGAKWILPYPQYWGFRFTGVAASEITSIGCHTDLWNFGANTFSDLVEGQGWREKFAPMRAACEILGPVRPELARKLGLAADIPVHVGIHDSNASLLPHVMSRTPPFAVVSTGTWVVVCAPGGNLRNLDPARDSFANIDALGRPVPSARFMGGREYTELTGNTACEPGTDAVVQVLENKWLLLPSVSHGSGPFPFAASRQTIDRADISADAHHAMVSFYLAMMTAECLMLTGASGDILVEGPFAANALFVQMLKAATGRPVLIQKSSRTGTSVGAALLALGTMDGLAAMPAEPVVGRFELEMAAYGRQWREMTQASEGKIR